MNNAALIISLACTEDGIDYPLFGYEKILFDNLMPIDGIFKDKHLWVKKATGLGVTEFMLRIMAWLCTKDVGHILQRNMKDRLPMNETH